MDDGDDNSTKGREKVREGKVLLVGKKEEGELQTDGIILDTAGMLSEKPEMLKDLEIEEEDKIIYICGHGNIKKRTIGGKKMWEIAEILVDSGYRGVQDIYVTSCDSNKEYTEKRFLGERKSTMVQDLKSSIESRINNSDGLKVDVNVESDAEGSTIVTEGKKGDIEIYVLKARSWKDRLHIKIKGYAQERYLKEIKADKIGVDLERYHNNLASKIAHYKHQLIANEIHRLDALGETDLIIGFGEIGLIGVSLMLLAILKLELNYILISQIAFLLVFVLELVKIMLVKFGNWERLGVFLMLKVVQCIAGSLIIFRLFQ